MSEDRAIWTKSMREFLLEGLNLQTIQGKRCDGGSGWKKDAWEAVRKILNEKFEVKFTVKQMKECFNNMKKDYQIVKELRDLSGFGWDDEQEMVTASKEVWDTYVAQHKEAKKFRGKPWPFFDIMHEILDGRIPNGSEKFYPTLRKVLFILIY